MKNPAPASVAASDSASTSAPVFEEFEPPADCDCAGCVQLRNSRSGERPSRGAHRALLLAAAAGTALGSGSGSPALAAPAAEHGQVSPAGPAVPGGPARPAADEPDGHPQGGSSALHGRGEWKPAQARPTTRADIIKRAKQWVGTQVPYSMDRYWRDGYRQDCSGFVSMAWNLGRNEWTGSLDRYAVRIGRDQLKPGDILLFHNPDDPGKGSHVTIFGGWTDYTKAYYLAYEQARPHARKQATPYAYWSHSGRYTAYRYKALSSPAPTAGSDVTRRYPGSAAFGPGTHGTHITDLGRLLSGRGGARFYRSGPGPSWGDADRRATQAFQRAQGWTGRDADGLPGRLTWEYLVSGKGRDIPAAASAPAATSGASAASVRVPAYPGRAHFRPGQSNPYVELLGKRLVQRGFGKYYAQGPGPRWGEADRRNVEAFQRAQGWRGGAADGFPGPETWRRLFS